MTAEDLIEALGLPPGCRLDRRVPKTLWPEPLRAAAGAAVEELRWVAVLRPENAAVPAAPEATEIQVLRVGLRDGGKPAAVAARVHKAVPYPVVLVLETGGEVWLSVGDVTCRLEDDPAAAAWLPTLELARQSRASLATLYLGWAAAARRWAEPARLAGEIARLRSQAAQEKRLSERARLNLRVQQLQSEFAAAQEELCPSNR